MKIIGLIQLKDQTAFEAYRQQVPETVNAYGGQITFRGARKNIFWNELNLANFQLVVEIEFPSQAAAQSWAESPDYKKLLPVRHQAMNLTLFGAE
jgi:uncharacterized protein (DUF1330 family)